MGLLWFFVAGFAGKPAQNFPLFRRQTRPSGSHIFFWFWSPWLGRRAPLRRLHPRCLHNKCHDTQSEFYCHLHAVSCFFRGSASQIYLRSTRQEFTYGACSVRNLFVRRSERRVGRCRLFEGRTGCCRTTDDFLQLLGACWLEQSRNLQPCQRLR